MEDEILIAAIGALLLLGAILKLQLQKKKASPWPLVYRIQVMVFPMLYLMAVILYLLNIIDLIVPAVVIGILEEIFFWCLRKRQGPMN